MYTVSICIAHLGLRLVLRIAAEVESHELPCPLLGDDDGSGMEVTVHHLHVTMEKVESLCYLQEAVLDLNWMDLVLLES